MKQENWFNRTFEFRDQEHIFPSILERLEGTPLRLEDKVSRICFSKLTVCNGIKWSIQEHIGHLLDLESIWREHLYDILSGKAVLQQDDLQNSKTFAAKHNEKNVIDLLQLFKTKRGSTIALLKQLSESDINQSSLHPRLQTSMRVMDLFLFVAEHDDHHLASITFLNML